MKKKIYLFMLLTAGCSMVFNGCKKKEDDDDDDSTPTNVLCDGNGSSSYYPLASGNTWDYTDGGFNNYDTQVTGTETHNANTYFTIESNMGGTWRLRQAANGDIMRYSTTDDTEYLYVPANPTTNQSWSYPMDFADTRKVASASTTLTTGSCSYTGLVKIQTYDGATLKNTFYFKKGLGLVSGTDVIGSAMYVDAVTLH